MMIMILLKINESKLKRPHLPCCYWTGSDTPPWPGKKKKKIGGIGGMEMGGIY